MFAKLLPLFINAMICATDSYFSVYIAWGETSCAKGYDVVGSLGVYYDDAPAICCEPAGLECEVSAACVGLQWHTADVQP